MCSSTHFFNDRECFIRVTSSLGRCRFSLQYCRYVLAWSIAGARVAVLKQPRQRQHPTPLSARHLHNTITVVLQWPCRSSSFSSSCASPLRHPTPTWSKILKPPNPFPPAGQRRRPSPHHNKAVFKWFKMHSRPQKITVCKPQNHFVTMPFRVL